MQATTLLSLTLLECAKSNIQLVGERLTVGRSVKQKINHYIMWGKKAVPNYFSNNFIKPLF